MKFDPTKPVTDLDGKDITEGDKVLTVAVVCQRALLAPPGAPVSGEENLRRFKLALRLHDATGLLELTAEEAALVKSQVAANFAPLVVGRVFQLIEGW